VLFKRFKSLFCIFIVIIMNLIIGFAQVMVMSTRISRPTHLGGTVVKPLVQFNGVNLCAHIQHSLF